MAVVKLITRDTTPEEKANWCIDQIQRIVTDEENTLTEDRKTAIEYYNGEKLGNEVEGRSQVVTTDVADTVEWVMPSLLRIFASGDEVCILQPRGAEDVNAVEVQHELANYQMRVRNNWFMVLHDFIKDALLLKTGVIKYQWLNDVQHIDKEYTGLTEPEVIALLSQGNVEVRDFSYNQSPIPQNPMAMQVTYNLTARFFIEDEYPLIEAVPPDEVGFPIDTRDVRDAPFFFHRVPLQSWEIIKKYGQEKFDAIKESADSLVRDERTVEETRFADLGGIDFWGDREKNRWWVYECYYRDEVDGTPWVTTLCGDVILADEENKYATPPFIVFTPIKMAHRVIGRSLFDLVKEIQKLRTVLTRQILDNIYFSNNGRYIGDPDRINVDDYLNNNRPGALVRGDPEAIKELLPPQLQPWTFKLMEYIQVEKENRTGVTRYNQGLDADSLNKTARGLYAILSQSQQRMEMMARLLAEMAIAPLIRAVVEMNIKFLKRSTAIRVTNKWIEITPDNIVGRYDVIVDVGIGTGNKDMVIAQMQQLLGIYLQIFQAGVPIVMPQNVYNAMKELIKAMGYRNVEDYITDPKTYMSVQQLIMVVEQYIVQLGIRDPILLQVLMQAKVALQGRGLPEAQGAGAQGGAPRTPEQSSATRPNMPQEPAQALNPIMTPTGNGYYGT